MFLSELSFFNRLLFEWKFVLKSMILQFNLSFLVLALMWVKSLKTTNLYEDHGIVNLIVILAIIYLILVMLLSLCVECTQFRYILERKLRKGNSVLIFHRCKQAFPLLHETHFGLTSLLVHLTPPISPCSFLETNRCRLGNEGVGWRKRYVDQHRLLVQVGRLTALLSGHLASLLSQFHFAPNSQRHSLEYYSAYLSRLQAQTSGRSLKV